MWVLGIHRSAVIRHKEESEDGSGVVMNIAGVPDGFPADVVVKSARWRSKRGKS